MARTDLICESGAAGYTAGTVLGGLVGLGISIWVSVEYIQPAFRSIKGVNREGADGLTALTWFAGLGEVAISGGMFVGALALGSLCCICAACASIPRRHITSSFFNRDNQNNSRATPVARAYKVDVPSSNDTTVHQMVAVQNESEQINISICRT